VGVGSREGDNMVGEIADLGQIIKRIIRNSSLASLGAQVYAIKILVILGQCGL
jgi:hypothetical protein